MTYEDGIVITNTTEKTKRVWVADSASGAGAEESCQPCLRGRYGDQKGLSSYLECKECPKRTFLDAFESKAEGDCKDCPLGSILNETGAKTIDDCGKW